DTVDVVALWEACGLTRPWNDPRADIARKQKEQPELFLVALLDGHVVGVVMGGYDGHRGSISYLAVAPDRQGQGVGRALVERIEEMLSQRGCPKINLQVRIDNDQVNGFYEALGYEPFQVTDFGKRLIPDG
ncbi:MAG: GNAT family acetyltransferase, partial [Propionibacteriaceae bacterium]|nr:GNAT family acetyltransferase [Propionibacteriaceae bacterium]